ncbi:ABC transporter ATP-binding protein [Leucothrix arctica]|uniref:Iron ABC transporter ATP-binding protein n=1 Tax=Leucothrix arctica TaxID=1481894 RepID=A0A317CG58_9GAMM|nr:ABC transporter ATP-binding protein [Leucothrix arctica]PWQ97506.1 iron ABC transporter ATP-binding protein [Leucothrix arctica]
MLKIPSKTSSVSIESAATLSVENVSWSSAKSERMILSPISFSLEPGRILGVTGPNGAGKSTLLRLLYRYHMPNTGSVKINGVDIWSIPAREAARTVAAVLQEQPTDFALTVHEIVSLGRIPHRKGFSAAHGAHDTNIVLNTLDRLELSHFANRQFGTLSGGERQRVMVARALAQEPKLMVLDEPTNHLDIRHQLEVLELIRDLPLTIVTSLHDLNMATSVCDDVLILKDGRSLGFGTPETVFSEETISNAFRVTAKRDRLVSSNAKHLSFNL